jgi:preprotein translocase subunit SecG
LLIYILYTIFFISCIVLVAAVLLQPGKTDAGALFTSNVSSSAFGPRGTATILSKLTIAAATVFMLTALIISMPSISGSRSVLQTVGETPAETTTAPENPVAPTGDGQAPITEPVIPGTLPADAAAPAANSAPAANAPAPATNKAPASNAVAPKANAAKPAANK